ncbi:hypothetical protein BJF78_32060 [Pseudonocardia sp. CNS-139]|nr:hypothetical protein BJF78_32060 [Pseudonocardia sp. CNS-139]
MGSEVDEQVDERAGVLTAARYGDGDGFAASTASAGAECGDAPGCTGKAATKTTGAVTAAPAVRTTSGGATCETAAGRCDAGSASEVSDTAAETADTDRRAAAAGPAGRELAATSTAGAQADCDVTACRGAATSTTTGARAATSSGCGTAPPPRAARCTARAATARPARRPPWSTATRPAPLRLGAWPPCPAR